ncbi:MAG TPA: PepSY-associated TM helix domain-containing protein [Sphingomicrobium sp.]|nr:PepSY-associated TM helix domain-containing protein [Sphingomicrobium sp.]
MRTISTIHRWAGGFIGLLLALIGLTGAILLWEGEWLSLPGAHDPLHENVASIAAIAERAASAGDLSRITFASDETALHQLVFADGSGAYVRQDGAVVDRWATQWERPELWLFDLHHHLFSGHVGETVTGIAGIAGFLFVVTGSLLWWRSRRRFAPTLWPGAFTPAGIVKHHRDLGILAAPLLLVSISTGLLMVFPGAADMILSPLAADEAGQPPVASTAVPNRTPIAAALEQSKRIFPRAALRRLSLPAATGGPIAVRMKQDFEWTPNGRTQLTFDASNGRLLTIDDPSRGPSSAAVREKFYPIHSAKVGPVAYKMVMTLSGLSLFVLGLFATYSFWLRKGTRSRLSRLTRHSSLRMRTVSPTRRNRRKGAQAASSGG